MNYKGKVKSRWLKANGLQIPANMVTDKNDDYDEDGGLDMHWYIHMTLTFE